MRKNIIDKLMLFAFCTLCLALSTPTPPMIAAWLVSVCVSALCSCFSPKNSFFLCAAFCVACVFFHELFVFLPLIAYDCAALPKLWQKLAGVPPLAYSAFLYDRVEVSIAVCLLFVLAYLLQYQTSKYDKAQLDYNNAHDEIKEKTLRLERKNHELMEKQDYEIRLATLSERNRIAREIHDNVGHLLTRSILQVGALQVVCGEDENIKEQLDCVKETLCDAMQSIRSSVHNLHDEAIDVQAQLNTLAEEFSFCPVTVNYDARELPKEVKYCFISIVREGLSNIAKHSNATHAEVSVIEHPAFYQLTVKDNGVAVHKTDSNGIGLQNMKERVESLNGVFSVRQDSGFRIFISIPKGR